MPLSVRLAALPPGVLLTIMVVLSVAVSYFGFRLVRRLLRNVALESHHDIAGFVFASVGVIYGVLLGFATLQVWEEMSQAEERLALEDGTARAIYRYLRSYPDRAAARPALDQYERYVRSVLRDEFPALSRLENSKTTQAEFQKFWDVMSAMTPSTEIEKVSFAQIYTLLGQLSQYRAMRMEAADGSIPSPLWHALIWGALFTIGFTWMFRGSSFAVQFILNTSLALLVGIMLYVIIIVNHPFTGLVRIEPRGYEVLMQLLDEAKHDGRDQIAFEKERHP